MYIKRDIYLDKLVKRMNNCMAKIITGVNHMGFNLDGFADNIKEDRTAEDLLFQVMLDLGVPLSSKITQGLPAGQAGGEVWNVNDGYLIACFGKVDDVLLTAIAKQTPYYAVFREASFVSDSAMVNFEQIFATYSPSTIRRIL
jgi:adenine-specific DNA-methyltransferase